MVQALPISQLVVGSLELVEVGSHGDQPCYLKAFPFDAVEVGCDSEEHKLVEYKVAGLLATQMLTLKLILLYQDFRNFN